ncbi:L-serine ammonia-lyase [Pseudonocardia kongjuensis]|uniref:L-serine dehydratase n=1 Tax=Pseudonocardia kongjuensis TaxID=102227 RepID=A0ABN1XQF7_9PSEU
MPVPVSVFDLFSIGIGPSSSHTVGPMRAAARFVTGLAEDGLLPRVGRVRAELFGSLGATGHGHGSGPAVLLGLLGERPETVDTARAPDVVAGIGAAGRLRLGGRHEIAFSAADDVVLHRRRTLPEHPNGMEFRAWDADGGELRVRTFYSVGGGFVRGPAGPPDGSADGAGPVPSPSPFPFPFHSGADLLATCARTGLPVSGVMRGNERVHRDDTAIDDGLLRIWAVMQDCVRNGCERDGVLPGGLRVRRRAPGLHRWLLAAGRESDPLHVMDWVSLFAMAVNEENASGGRIVTAPTNGAAGIVPAVLHYYRRFVPGADDAGVVRFLLTAGAIGSIIKENASISGAEVGCQGEVGSAAAMAAAGLTEVLGGTPEQVENAAEIAVEHHLGLTCDPVGGLVQIPCIERNAVGAAKAVHAARMALYGDGTHVVSLDKAVKTMRETGADMKVKYKETSRGGLAVNVIEC